ncbi:BEN domain [Trinorchestia longiramus]|nr:BEN domain [Trinorchestia longiramus]
MGDTLPSESLLHQLIDEVHQLRMIVSDRLGSLESNVCVLSDTCSGVAVKLDTMEVLVQHTHDVLHGKEVITGASSEKLGMAYSCSDTGSEGRDAGSGVLATSTGVMRLPGVEDYPDGTWLGDPDVPSRRVRSPITPQNLLHINSTCMTAEKMALTLLDYLFSRDELASSNISGRSRNNKKQLDPMMVYGIRCHLQYKFAITTKEWSRICQNMDSKCRSAWKRKMKSLPLVSQQSNKIIKVCHAPVRSKEPSLSDEIGFDFEQLHPSNLDLSCVKMLLLTLPHKKKSHTDKSGDLGRQGTLPNLEITRLPNNSRTASNDCRAV